MTRRILILCFAVLFYSCGDDMPEPPVDDLPQLSIDGLSVLEGNTNKPVFISLRLSKLSLSTVTAVIETMDNTATAGEDYVAISSETIEFVPGDVQANIEIVIIGDEEFEENETFFLRVASVSGATLANAQSTITIENDDINNSLVIPTTGYVTPLTYSGMQLIWSDEFDGQELDATYWSHDLGTGTQNGLDPGWGNNELQYYREENTSLVDGHLVIQANKESYAGRNYTSSRIKTKDKFDFRYGRVDIRAVLPVGKGMWPALWMLGANIDTVSWPACGEIDIVEILGSTNPGNQIKATCHWSDPNSNEPGNRAEYGETYTLNSGLFDEEFHVFSLRWTENRIQALVDDNLYFTINTNSVNLSEFRNKFFLLFNVAVGGNAVGSPNSSTIFPKYMIVDYIRVFQEM